MNLSFTNKKIGIWGFGISGKAILNYFVQNCPDCCITVLDTRFGEQDTLPYKNNKNDAFLEQDAAHILQFLATQDIIVPSPGIDLQPYNALYRPKFIAEADLFYSLWKKPIIAV